MRSESVRGFAIFDGVFFGAGGTDRQTNGAAIVFGGANVVGGFIFAADKQEKVVGFGSYEGSIGFLAVAGCVDNIISRWFGWDVGDGLSWRFDQCTSPLFDKRKTTTIFSIVLTFYTISDCSTVVNGSRSD